MVANQSVIGVRVLSAINNAVFVFEGNRQSPINLVENGGPVTKG
jgi:hypothetical protein